MYEKEIKEIRKEYDRLDLLCGVSTKDIEIVISKRAKKRLGLCEYRNYLPHRIIISAFLLDDPDKLLEVIRHEYAHALVRLREPGENHGHDKVWKDACEEVDCPTDRCTELPESQKKNIEDNSPYVLTCQSCGKKLYYQRKSKLIRTVLEEQERGAVTSKYFHKGCGGRFVVECRDKSCKGRREIAQVICGVGQCNYGHLNCGHTNVSKCRMKFASPENEGMTCPLAKYNIEPDTRPFWERPAIRWTIDDIVSLCENCEAERNCKTDSYGIKTVCLDCPVWGAMENLSELEAESRMS